MHLNYHKRAMTYPKTKDHRPKTGFTLVELLVVITIIGILIALLLPAVQAAREAARRLQCTNNLKQIGVAVLTHEERHGFLPSGGWGCYAGEPTCGFDRRQPGSWLYNILPYMEQQSLHDLGVSEGPALDENMFPRERLSFLHRVTTPVATFVCPSRRKVSVYAYDNYVTWPNVALASQVKAVGRTDYAASMGDASLGVTDDPPGLVQTTKLTQEGWMAAWGGMFTTGPCYRRSMVRLRDIKDGCSNTYLVGEKYVNPDHYHDGNVAGDDQSWDSSFVFDVMRWSGEFPGGAGKNMNPYAGQYALGEPEPGILPRQDTPGLYGARLFGSAHAGSFNMALCDGSVHSVSYSIDPETHHRLGNIADGKPVDAGAF